MITMEEARIRVARGAAHLDQVRPHWFNEIDTGTLTLHDPCGCIVGQLIGVYSQRTVRALFQADSGLDFGLDLDGNDCRVAMGHGRSRASMYAPLQDAWIDAIAARRHPVTEDHPAPREAVTP